jgi:hypothetical protein
MVASCTLASVCPSRHRHGSYLAIFGAFAVGLVAGMVTLVMFLWVRSR